MNADIVPHREYETEYFVKPVPPWKTVPSHRRFRETVANIIS